LRLASAIGVHRRCPRIHPAVTPASRWKRERARSCWYDCTSSPATAGVKLVRRVLSRKRATPRRLFAKRGYASLLRRRLLIVVVVDGVVAFPRGERGAHQLVNHTVRFLAFSRSHQCWRLDCRGMSRLLGGTVAVVAASMAFAGATTAATSRCGRISVSGDSLVVRVESGHLACSRARKVMRTFMSGHGTEHGGPSSPSYRKYWTLPGGWTCGFGAGGGSCHRGGVRLSALVQ